MGERGSPSLSASQGSVGTAPLPSDEPQRLVALVRGLNCLDVPGAVGLHEFGGVRDDIPRGFLLHTPHIIRPSPHPVVGLGHVMGAEH